MNMIDMMKMMGQLKDVQGRMKDATQAAAKIVINAESGAGLVKTTVNGQRQIISLDIDASLLKAEDKSIVQDLVIAAVNKAFEDLDAAMKDEMQKQTAGMLPNMPGLDLSALGL